MIRAASQALGAGLATLSLAAAASQTSRAADPPAPRIYLADHPDENFTSIQEAINTAPPGAEIRIGPGRFEERLVITQSVKLVGAGADKTTIGPTLQAQVERRELLAKCTEAISATTQADADPLAAGRLIEELQTALAVYSAPVVRVEDARDVELHALKITLPDTPQAKSGLISASAVSLEHAAVRLHDCAVVGCMGDGIRAEEGSELEIDDCLVAGVWGTGVAVLKNKGPLKIARSDIRNCYHNNIWTGPLSEPSVIEDCRISGSAWFGIRYGDRQPLIQRNAIFENARAGIYAEGGGGEIKQNLISKNAGGGVACWAPNKATLEGNLFVENQPGGIGISGDCQNTIRHNLFWGGAMAVSYGSVVVAKQLQSPATPPTLEGPQRCEQNIFWKIEQPAVVRKRDPAHRDSTTEPLALLPEAGNRTLDPKLTMSADEPPRLAADSPLKAWDLSGVLSVSTKSRWPLTPEEKAMLSDDGSREWSKWKMRPAPKR